MIKKIAFTAYAVTDIAKARSFYEGVLGLVPSSEYPVTVESQWIEYDIGPDTLGIGKSDEWIPSEDGASAALEVDNFDEMAEMFKAKGITIVTGPHDFPSCRMIVVRDPDNNKITIHQKK